MLDLIDRQILNILQEDGRIPNKEIAARIGMVPSATSERLRKLRDHGIIKQFETRLNPDKVGYGLMAFVFVRTNEEGGSWETGHELAKISQVQEVFNIAGEDCYLVKVRTNNTESLATLLRTEIGAINSVTSTRTTIVMQSYKETCAIPLSDKINSSTEKQ